MIFVNIVAGIISDIEAGAACHDAFNLGQELIELKVLSVSNIFERYCLIDILYNTDFQCGFIDH